MNTLDAFWRNERFAWRRGIHTRRKARADVHPLDLAAFPLRLVAGFAAAGFVWLVAAELGARMCAIALGRSPQSRVLGAALGYAIIGTLVALLGVFHLSTPPFVVGLVIVIALLRTPAYLAHARSLPATLRALATALAKLSAVSRAALLVGEFGFATALVAAALPSSWWDPIAYHLPIASAALAHGTFAFNPGMVQSAFPALGEAAALPAYALAGSAGAAISTLFAGLALAAVVWLLAERLAPGTGPLGAALIASSGVWLWLAPSFYVDVPLALFVVAAIATPLLAQDESGRWAAVHPIAVGLLCGAFAGAAASVKYTGLGGAVVALGVLLIYVVGMERSTRSNKFDRSMALGGFALGFVVIAVGWYVRNLTATGDPVYPLLAGSLGLPDAAVAFASRYIDMTRHWCGGGTSVIDVITLPYRLLADPRSFCGDPGYALRLGAIFVIACVVVLRASWPLAGAAALLTLIWFVSSQEWRFLLPAVALFAALTAVGTGSLTTRMHNIGGMLLLLLGAAGILVNWLPGNLAFGQASHSIVPGYAYIAGREDANAYLRRRLETFGAAQWLSTHAVSKDEVISLDDVRTYYPFGGMAWANPYYQQVWNLDWTVPPSTRYAPLRAAGYRYLMVNGLAAYVDRTPSGVDWNILASDVSGGELKAVFVDGDVSIYALAQHP